MVNHGISTGALFLLVGVIYNRAHTREMEAFGGLATVMPKYATAVPDRDAVVDRAARPQRLRG
jgi:NADH:ubiquinone oxidoreductase subunit 4 (subunit M)